MSFWGLKKMQRDPFPDGHEHLRATLVSDDAFDEITGSYAVLKIGQITEGNFLFASEDWLGTDTNPKMNPDKPAVIYVGAIS